MARTGEVVVVLGHIGHDAETIRDTHGDHVIGVQESRDPQLFFSHFKGQTVILEDIFLGERLEVTDAQGRKRASDFLGPEVQLQAVTVSAGS